MRLWLCVLPTIFLLAHHPAWASTETPNFGFAQLVLSLLASGVIGIAIGIFIFRHIYKSTEDTPQSRRYLATIERISQGFALFLREPDQHTRQESLDWLLKETAKALDAAQVSLWLFDDRQDNLAMAYAFDARLDLPDPMPLLNKGRNPMIMGALRGERTITFIDAQNNSQCSDFLNILPENNKPRSLLIAMVGTGKQAHGALFISTRQHLRKWNDSDRQFASSIADLIAFYLSNSELHMAQKALRSSETRFRDLVDASSDWYWETDAQHRFIYFSDKFTTLTGIPQEDILGKTRLNFQEAHNFSSKWAQHKNDLINHRPFRDFQYKTYVGGREICVNVNGKPFFDENAQFVGYRGTGSDITETTTFRTRFEEGLNALPNGFLMWDSDDRLVLWNNTIFDMFPVLTPYASRSMTYLELMKICAKEDVIKFPRPLNDTYAEKLAQIHKAGGINELELSDGRYLLVNEHATSEGGIVSIYTDITTLKEREKELLESKKVSETLSSCSNILFHARNESFILSEICRIVTETYPFETAWISLFHSAGKLPEFLKVNMQRGYELPLEAYRPSRTLKQIFIKQEHMLLDEGMLMQAFPDVQQSLHQAEMKSGGIFPIWVDTKITGFLCVTSRLHDCFNDRYVELMRELANDVGYGLTSLRSEHSRLIAEEALRESESRYRSLVDMSPDAILVLDEKHQIVFANPEGHVLFATSNRSEIFQTCFYDFLDVEQDLFANAPRITDDDPTQFISSVTLRRLNDTLFEADITARPVSYAGLTTRLLIIRDVTERNRVNEHLAQTSKLATLGEMAAGITHELSQPLNIMRFAAEGSLLKMQRDSLDKNETQKKFDLISMQCGRMADIIDHMRIFSRKDTGGEELFDPTLVVRQAVDLVESQFFAEGIHLDVRYPPHYAKLKGRPIQLEQVILNLVNNARDAINQRHKTLSGEDTELKQITLLITYDQGDHKINIAITDNGGGIPEDALAKLFDPFFTTKEVGKGTGLGLSVSYGIIAAMGGTIRARNIHKGARFDITLPCPEEGQEDLLPRHLKDLKTISLTKDTSSIPSVDIDEDEEDLDIDVDGARVLVVDDEIYAAEAMMEYLFQQGYHVNIAGDGEEALELYEMEPVDVVVTDMRMPKMDGYVLIKNLKARSPGLPVIVVTGHTGIDDADQQDLNTLAFKVMKKPVSLSELSTTIENALQSLEEVNNSTIED